MGGIVPPVVVNVVTAILSILTTTGDLLYRGGAGLSRLAIGSSNHVLTVAGGLPTWAAGSKATLTTTGDILYASAANTLARLAAGTSGHVLTSGGPGVAPAWAAGQTYFGLSPGMDWNWYIVQNAITTGLIPYGNSGGATYTDSTSQLVTDATWGRFFQQATTAGAGNTTVWGLTSTAGASAITAPDLKPLWIYAMTPSNLTTWGTDQAWVANFGCSTTALAATATEEVQSVGFSSLNGDANVLFCFTRAAGASTRETTGLTLSSTELYYLIVDYALFPTSVTCRVIRVSDNTQLYTKTWSSNLPSTNTTLGRFSINSQNIIAASVYNVRHKFLYVVSQKPSLSLP